MGFNSDFKGLNSIFCINTSSTATFVHGNTADRFRKLCYCHLRIWQEGVRERERERGD